MFKGCNLIEEQEDYKAFLKQQVLINAINENKQSSDVLKLAILQTQSLNNDWETAYTILSIDIVDNYEYLVIGSYIANYIGVDRSENLFYQKLINNYEKYNDSEKAIVLYIKAFILFHSERNNRKVDLIRLIDEAISLNDQCPSFYELRFLLSKDDEYEKTANKCRVIMDKRDCQLLADSLDPWFFIEWYILHKYDYPV